MNPCMSNTNHTSMRKTLKICSLAALALLLQSCVNDVTPPEDIEVLKDGQIVFALPDFNAAVTENADTKTYYDGSKLVWSANDTIGIIPGSGSLIYFTGIGGSENVTFDGGGWKLKASTQYTSFYPFIDDMYLDKTAVKYSVEGQSQQTNNTRVHDGYDCLYSKATTTEGSAVNFSFTRLCICLGFQVTPPSGTYTRIDICATEDIIPLEATVDLTADSPALTTTRSGNKLSLALGNIAVDGSTQINAYMMAIPCDWKDKTLTINLVTSDGKVYSYSTTPGVKFDTPNTPYIMQLSAGSEFPNSAFLSQTEYGLYSFSGNTATAIFQYAAGDQISRFIRPELCEFRIGNPFSGKFMAFTMIPGSDDTHKTLEIYAPYKHTGAASDYTTYSGIYENAEVLYHDGDLYYLRKDNLGFIVKYTEL